MRNWLIGFREDELRSSYHICLVYADEYGMAIKKILAKYPLACKFVNCTIE